MALRTLNLHNPKRGPRGKSKALIQLHNGRPFLPAGARSTVENIIYLRRLVWRDLIALCTNSAHPQFPRYGACGITVCESWLDEAAFNSELGPIPNGMILIPDTNQTVFSRTTTRWIPIEDDNEGEE
jgi:hypothetical protein